MSNHSTPNRGLPPDSSPRQRRDLSRVWVVEQTEREQWSGLQDDDIRDLKAQIRQELGDLDIPIIVLPPGCIMDLMVLPTEPETQSLPSAADDLDAELDDEPDDDGDERVSA